MFADRLGWNRLANWLRAVQAVSRRVSGRRRERYAGTPVFGALRGHLVARCGSLEPVTEVRILPPQLGACLQRCARYGALYAAASCSTSRGASARSAPPAAISSSCVPCSTMRPCSSTTIRPARWIVESRCAITIAVRPASRRRRARLDPRLGVQVDARGRLVEDQDARVGDQRARERDELPLAGRELRAALADLGVVAVLERGDELVRADRARRAADLLRRRFGRAERDVLGDRAGEQEGLLRARSRAASAATRCSTSRRSWPSTSTRPQVGS